LQATLTAAPGQTRPARASRPRGPEVRSIPMSKEKNKGNREAKKPKKEKPKVLATANSNFGKALDINTPRKGK
jgi:hypothetical protein